MTEVAVLPVLGRLGCQSWHERLLEELGSLDCTHHLLVFGFPLILDRDTLKALVVQH